MNDGHALRYAEIDYTKGVITMARDCNPGSMGAISLLHEILHGIAQHMGRKWQFDEKLIDDLARGLYMVIADNPGLFAPEEATTPEAT